MTQLIIANIINLFAGMLSVLSVEQKTKYKIVTLEYVGNILRILMNILIKSWSDLIAKIIKFVAQFLCLEKKLNENKIYIIALVYLLLSLTVTYYSKDLRCLIAIVPSILELTSLLTRSTKKYRLYIIITKIFWTINNLMFHLYIGIIFDAIVMIGHYNKIRNKK